MRRLEGLVDTMVEEQQLAFARMREYEVTLKEQDSDPTWRAPDPASLKRPLCGTRGCLVSLRRGLREAKQELLECFDGSVSSHFSGRLVTEHAVFTRCVVHLPVLIILILNITLSIVQVVLAAELAVRDNPEPAAAPVGPRVADMAAVLAPATSTRRLLSGGGSGGGHEEEAEVLECLRPALVQAALCLAQAAAALALTRGPAACAVASAKISGLEAELNVRVNRLAGQMVESSLGPAFAEVRAEAAAFFPQFRDCMEKLRASAQRRRRAGRLQDLEKQAMRLGL